MNLQNVRVYQAVIENRGMSAAARQLGLSPTAVSKQIKVLEKELAIQLIKRTSSHFAVTDAGQFLYESCIAILRDFDGLKESIRFLHTTPTGNLKVFATQAFSEKFITPNLKEFRQQFPGILLNIDIADRYPDLQKEGIDLCLGIMDHWDVDLIKKKLLDVHWRIAGSPGYFQEFGRPKKLADLEQHRFVCHGNRPNPYLISMRDGSSMLAKPAILVSDHSAYLSCALAGLGLIHSFDMITQSLVDEGKLEYVLLNAKFPQQCYYAFYPPTRHVKPAARALLDFLIAKCR